MDLQTFHRFQDLPRELQLRVWEIYEADRPCARHYFRNMVYLKGSLYGATQQDNYRLPSPHPAATLQDPEHAEVPDRALTADSKILLSEHCTDDHEAKCVFLYDETEPLSALSFRRIRSYSHETQSFWRRVNFKLDTFCFSSARRSSDAPTVLDFFDDKLGTSAPVSLRHWFFRIQKLDLLVTSRQSQLGQFDKRILAGHPSVRTVTLVPTIHQLICEHTSLDVIDEHDPVREMDRLPLPKVVLLLEATTTITTTEPCDCSEPRDRLSSLQSMKQELVDLFSGLDRRVDVLVDVEVYWNTTPDIDALIAGAAEEKKRREATEGAVEDAYDS